MNKFNIIWSVESISDLRKIKNNISKSNLKKIVVPAKKIVFVEQYQKDEFRLDCRRIIIGNYKVLYQFSENTITIIRIFNSKHNPQKSL